MSQNDLVLSHSGAASSISGTADYSKNRASIEDDFVLTAEETEDISYAWDYLLGHVGLKV